MMTRARFLLPLLAPYFLLLGVFWAGPVFQGAKMSGQQVSRFTRATKPVGFANYRWALRQPALRKALGNTAVYTLASTALILPLALALAHLLRAVGPKLRAGLGLVLLLPAITPPIVLAILFLHVFHGSERGLINALVMGPLGLGPFDFFRQPMPGLVLQAVWRWTGFVALLLLCGLEAQPRALREAARLDGAGAWALLRHITLPLLGPVLVFAAVFLFIDTFVIGTGAFTLLGSSGGQMNRGLLLVNYIEFTRTKIGAGRAAAVSMLLLPALTAAFALLFVAVRRRAGA